jgi:hypothetical protein
MGAGYKEYYKKIKNNYFSSEKVLFTIKMIEMVQICQKQLFFLPKRVSFKYVFV